MTLFLWILAFVASLFFLVKSADYFTSNAEKLGLAFGLSSFIVGATIVAIGTSLPELVSSLYAVTNGAAPEFVADNVIGSNIANALLVLGVATIFARTLKVDTSLIDVDLPFFFMSMSLFVFFIWDGSITAIEGIMLLLFFVIFLFYNMSANNDPRDKDEMRDLKTQFKNTRKKKDIWKYVGLLVLSGAVIAISAKFFIDSLLNVSEIIGISSSVLTITIVALGTSLPEVLTSIAAIRLGNHAMVIGNVFGSNTFNVLLVTGIPALFTELPISDISLAIGIPFLVIATFAAIFTTFDNTMRHWEGWAVLFLYIVFLGKITGLL